MTAEMESSLFNYIKNDAAQRMLLIMYGEVFATRMSAFLHNRQFGFCYTNYDASSVEARDARLGHRSLQKAQQEIINGFCLSKATFLMCSRMRPSKPFSGVAVPDRHLCFLMRRVQYYLCYDLLWALHGNDIVKRYQFNQPFCSCELQSLVGSHIV